MLYRRLRYLLRFYLAYLTKYRGIIAATLIIILAAISLYPLVINRLPRYRPTITIGLTGRHSITNLPMHIQKKLSIGLTVLDFSNQPAPGLAKEWDATDSSSLYTFYLDNSFTWSDGKPIKSTDIVLNFKDTEVSYPDPSTLKIRLTQGAYSPFPAIVSRPIFRQNPFVGTGSYKVSRFHQKGDFLSDLTLTPVDSQSRLPKLIYRFYPSQEIAITALKLGEVDSLEQITHLGDLLSWDKFDVNSKPDYSKVIAVIFNTKSQYFSGSQGKILRSSLNIAIDKSSYEYPAVGPIPINSWAYPQKIKSPLYDPDKALLQIKKIELLPKPLVLYSFPTYLDLAENLKQDWEKVGLQTQIASINDFPQQYDAILMPISIPSDPDQYSLWHSTSETYNYSHLNNPRIDKLLEDGRKESSLEKRQKIYEDFQKYFLDETPAAILFHPILYSIHRI